MNESNLQTVYLQQGNLSMAMDLSQSLIQAMNALRAMDPQKWEDRDLDLLKEVNRQLGSKA